MSPAIAEKLYTVEEFETLPDFDTFELLDGVPVEKAMGNRSSSVTGNLWCLLAPFVKQHKLGRVYDAESGYVLFPETSKRVRKPDLSFVRKGRFADDMPPDGFARLAPDFAFESVSPLDLAEELQAKVEEYLRAKVPLVWVAYPASKIVLAYRPDGTAQRFAADQTATADDVFPGFACPLAELFA